MLMSEIKENIMGQSVIPLVGMGLFYLLRQIELTFL